MRRNSEKIETNLKKQSQSPAFGRKLEARSSKSETISNVQSTEFSKQKRVAGKSHKIGRKALKMGRI